MIIPSYNAAHLIGRAIRSVLSQTYRQFEIIVVDDGSTDDTATVAESFRRPALQIIRHPRNSGASAARNSGLRNAGGVYVAFLDSDDEWHPEKIQKQVECFARSSPAVGLVYTGWRWIIEENGKLVQDKLPRFRGHLHEILLAGDCVGSTSTPLIKASLLSSVGGFDETLPARQDWDLWLRLSPQCLFEFVPEILVKYYMSGTGISGSLHNKRRGTEMVVQKFQEEFDSHPKALASQYVLLTIFSLLEDNLGVSRSYAMKSLSHQPLNLKVYWKAGIHLMLSMLGKRFRQSFFRWQQMINKDFYWIVSHG